MAKTIKILLIEDNPADVLLVREMLRDACDIRFDLHDADRLASGIELHRADRVGVQSWHLRGVREEGPRGHPEV